MKRDLTIFMKMGSIGALCVICLIVFVIIYGFLGISNTSYKVYATPSSDIGINKELHNIFLFDKGFSSLAGSLCAGYYMH